MADFPSLSTVSPSLDMLEVGFKAKLAIKSCPVDIPPEVPPEELDLKPLGEISSLLSDPLVSTTENQAPNSTP